MSRRSLEAAVNMKGAFNDISIKTQRNIAIEDVLSRVDGILIPYGGLISFARKDQLSNFFVSNELKQLKSMGSLAPVIFLSVAAFLINVVMFRQVAIQREQIGMLKAVGLHQYRALFTLFENGFNDNRFRRYYRFVIGVLDGFRYDENVHRVLSFSDTEIQLLIRNYDFSCVFMHVGCCFWYFFCD
jgi:hypothetical protein